MQRNQQIQQRKTKQKVLHPHPTLTQSPSGEKPSKRVRNGSPLMTTSLFPAPNPHEVGKQVEAKVETKVKAEAKAETKTEAKAIAEAKAEAEAQAKAKAEAKAKAKAIAEAKAIAIAEIKAKVEAKAKVSTLGEIYYQMLENIFTQDKMTPDALKELQTLIDFKPDYAKRCNDSESAISLALKYNNFFLVTLMTAYLDLSTSLTMSDIYRITERLETIDSCYAQLDKRIPDKLMVADIKKRVKANENLLSIILSKKLTYSFLFFSPTRTVDTSSLEPPTPNLILDSHRETRIVR